MAEAAPLRQQHCGNQQGCVVVTLYGALPAAMTDADGNIKDCNQQVPNWRYHKTYGSETDFFYGYVMDLVQDDGSTIPACTATLAQRENATVWRAVMRPDVNIPRGFSEGDQIEFETTINFSRAQTFGDNVNYYGQTHKYILGQGFTINNQDPAIGPIGINDSFAALGGDTTLNQLAAASGVEQRFAFMQHAANIGPNNIQPFLEGRRLFHTDFTTGRHVEEFRPGPQAVGGNLPFPEYAGLANDPIQPSCTQCHSLNGNNQVQERQDVVPPKMIGLGLLEAIPDAQIEAWSAESGGTVSRVTINEQVHIGRFGWRAETASIQHQVAKALRDDMGIATHLFPVNNNPIDDEALQRLTIYSSLLAVPVTRANITQMPGHTYFQDIGCNQCHKMTVTTGNHALPALSHQTIHPYTDLLLHDLGEGPYRTAPLWGLGLSGFVRTGDNQQWHLMHDGLSQSLEAAIERHQGAAAESSALYNQLRTEQKQALQNYLQAL